MTTDSPASGLRVKPWCAPDMHTWGSWYTLRHWPDFEARVCGRCGLYEQRELAGDPR